MTFCSVEKPPIISEPLAKEVPVEVLPPLVAGTGPTRPAEGAPVHSLSALILVAVDSLWAVFDWLPPVWLFAIPGCFVAVSIPTYLIQRHLKNDSHGRALAFATLFGVLAAIPTPITGTTVGLSLMAWTGLGKLLGRSPPK
jgi:hypothetical protein